MVTEQCGLEVRCVDATVVLRPTCWCLLESAKPHLINVQNSWTWLLLPFEGITQQCFRFLIHFIRLHSAVLRREQKALPPDIGITPESRYFELHAENLSLKGEQTTKITQKLMEFFHSISKIYYTIIAVVGVPVNLVAILILSRGKCGLSKCTTYYLVAMATTDLLVITTAVIFEKINTYYFPGSFLDITPICSVIFVLCYVATDCSVWFTVTFSFDRFVAICCQKLKGKYCSEKTVTVVLATTCILLCLKNIPWYFAVESKELIDNIPFFCNIKPSYYTDPGWVGYNCVDKALTPLLPYIFILLFNALTVRHIFVTSRVRKNLRSQRKCDNHSDPEMESRRKSVILLFTISGSFVLLWLLYLVEFFLYIITGMNPEYYNHSLCIFANVAIMTLNLNCCTNAFIYGQGRTEKTEGSVDLSAAPEI
ncbi:probable G-protein coupled receptor 139 [Stegostoma tigrinum]|uniref:probable G-protein coupled receptor 139 n=1 Tax=Stegostoma tigrinum TaxID=3053191 RepID=UPI00286FF84A|nr:probable G-protein coupled receptor 139 [Stegostoma tigrinum]